MKVVSYPGNMEHAQHVALALFEIGHLAEFVTTLNFSNDGWLASALKCMPGKWPRDALDLMERKSIDLIPSTFVCSVPLLDTIRSVVGRYANDPILADRIWEKMCLAFDSKVANYHLSNIKEIHAFEYAALATIKKARELGVRSVLHLPSLDSKHFEAILRREKRIWPELKISGDVYYEKKFQERYERRLAEISLADTVIANSSLTARSHIEAGADPKKLKVVRLALPRPAAEATFQKGARHRPLRVIYAGNVSIGKGAHYLLMSWKELNARTTAVLDIYGALAIPTNAIGPLPENVVLHGSVSRKILHSAFREADVLVFPTLADGFGMVVAEAFANGLPVITTEQAGVSELINSKNGILIAAGEVASITNSIRWCLDNRLTLQEMKISALETARNRQWCHFRRDLIESLGVAAEEVPHSS